MAITVNTNMQAIKVQGNLRNATTKMNTAMERMSSGYKINKSKDDAAGYAVAATLSKNIQGSKIAMQNAAMGQDLLSTAEGSLGVIKSNLERVRDLTEQAANGTYNSSDLAGIASEVKARLAQIQSQASSTTFNGKHLLDGSQSAGIDLQVGVYDYNSGAYNMLTLAGSIFSSVNVSTLANAVDGSGPLANAITAAVPQNTSNLLAAIDTVITNVVTRISDIGAFQNRLDAISDGLDVQKTNMTSALSTVKDADIAEESASFVQNQILQSASATLLSQANSAPQIALQLIQG